VLGAIVLNEMSDLKKIDKLKIEKFLLMESGYVLDFSNRTIQNFIIDSVGLDIYDKKYDNGSGSKAQRLRAFWDRESNYNVGKLLCDMLEYWRAKKLMDGIEITKGEQDLYTECEKIGLKLKEDTIVEHIEVIKEKGDGKDFKLLAKSIRESIEKNEPEAALDRLHTYVFKYIRQLCDEHKIEYNKEESLNAVFGKYIKHVVANKLVESAMGEKILKYSIGILDAFNDVRNNKSFAHVNDILNYRESILIFNNVTNSIKFIQEIEEKYQADQKVEQTKAEWDELPF
jgi:hypothetical protein